MSEALNLAENTFLGCLYPAFAWAAPEVINGTKAWALLEIPVNKYC